MSAEHSPEKRTGKRVEVGPDQHTILLLVTQPRAILERLGLPQYDVWFREALGIDAARLHVVNVTEEALPATVPQSGIIIGGSAHSTYEPNVPWIPQLEAFIRAMAEREKPMLGVCFGHQMIAQALGGRVEKGTRGREIGTANIQLTEAGEQDPLFRGLPSTIDLATSHADVVTQLPSRGDIVELGRNDKYPYQSLAIGKQIRTVQPHPEITCGIISTIVEARQDALVREGIIGSDGLQPFLEDIKRTDVQTPGRKILQNFADEFVVPYHQQHHL